MMCTMTGVSDETLTVERPSEIAHRQLARLARRDARPGFRNHPGQCRRPVRPVARVQRPRRLYRPYPGLPWRGEVTRVQVSHAPQQPGSQPYAGRQGTLETRHGHFLWVCFLDGRRAYISFVDLLPVGWRRRAALSVQPD